MTRKYLKAAGMAAILLGCSFVPAQAFTLGWNAARCGSSLVVGKFTVFLNDNGQPNLGTSSSEGPLTSAQIELFLACANGAAGYDVLINDTSNNNFIQLKIPIIGPAAATPPPHAAELSALFKQNANGP